ncbi:MAG TPA: dTMP kinase [Ignavibacteriaceae bacterium]|jgi:dTMP kinase|nr:dTMP kinase [Ignavibacteriaceae bacterium]
MFITFEGIDFCGKSTQVELLKKFFQDQKKEVKLIREPGGTEISEMVRSILLDKKHYHMVMETEIFLFSAARAQLVREKIRPYLNQGIYVISDRFHDSTTAYQGFGRGIDIESVKHINSLAIGETVPDITFFIDITIEEADRRKKLMQNFDPDRIEVSDSSFYERVRAGYLYIADNENRIKVINGMKSIEEIHNDILEEISFLEKKEIR